MSVRQRDDGVSENVDDTTGMVTHIFRPGTDTAWVAVQPYSAQAQTPYDQSAQPAQQPAVGYREVDPLEVENAIEEANTRSYDGQPPLVKIEDKLWVYIAPPATGGSFYFRTVDHWGWTERNYPLQCPRIDNLPCPLCDYLDQLEALAGDSPNAKTLNTAIGKLKAKDAFRYLVLPFDAQGHLKLNLGFRYISATGKLSTKLLTVIGRTPGILAPRTARPIQLCKTQGKTGFPEYDAVAYHEAAPWPPEAMELLQTGFYDLRRMKKIPDYKELKEELDAALLAGRVPQLPQVSSRTSVAQSGQGFYQPPVAGTPISAPGTFTPGVSPMSPAAPLATTPSAPAGFNPSTTGTPVPPPITTASPGAPILNGPAASGSTFSPTASPALPPSGPGMPAGLGDVGQRLSTQLSNVPPPPSAEEDEGLPF